jgi:hypothetical protein
MSVSGAIRFMTGGIFGGTGPETESTTPEQQASGAEEEEELGGMPIFPGSGLAYRSDSECDCDDPTEPESGTDDEMHQSQAEETVGSSGEVGDSVEPLKEQANGSAANETGRAADEEEFLAGHESQPNDAEDAAAGDYQPLLRQHMQEALSPAQSEGASKICSHGCNQTPNDIERASAAQEALLQMILPMPSMPTRKRPWTACNGEVVEPGSKRFVVYIRSSPM